jgi:hypothetical protein
VFDDHAHDVVLEKEPSLAWAIQVAERYGRKWKRSKSMAACKCGPIEIKRAKKK